MSDINASEDRALARIKRKSRRRELMNTLYDAAQELGLEDVGQWTRWVVYMLEVLQDSAVKEEYETFLYDVHTEVAARLGAGRW